MQWYAFESIEVKNSRENVSDVCFICNETIAVMKQYNVQ